VKRACVSVEDDEVIDIIMGTDRRGVVIFGVENGLMVGEVKERML